MNPLKPTDDWPEWVQAHSVWVATDERDFLAIMKAFDKFKEITGDPKLAAVLVMAWSTLQAKPRS